MVRAYQMTGNDRRGFHSATLASLAQVHDGNEAFTGSSHFGVWGWCSKRPGDRGQCRGTTTEHRSSPWAPQRPQAEDNPSGRQLKPRRPPQPRQPPQPPQARGRCTRYVAVHPLRGGAPEQKRCIAYGAGAVPQETRTNAELAHRTTHRHTPPCAAGPYWRQDGHAAHATTCTPAHSGPIRHLLHPYMRRARLPSPSNAEKGVGPGVSSGAHPQSVRIRPASRRRCARGTWPAAR